MEVCAGFELVAIENTTTRGDDLLEIGKGREVPIGERLIEDRPEVLGRLQFGGVAWQIDKPETLGHDQVRRGVPTGVVEPEYDDPLPSRPGLAGKQR